MICGSRRKDGRMREILFKAKRIDNGEWIEGNHVYLENAHYIVPLYIEWNETEQRESPMFIRVDRKTLCQYTEFEDENKNRIWENDIVSFIDYSSTESGYVEHNCVGRIAWDCECACFRVSGTLSAESWEVLQDCVIIGNVFDNPELLRQDGG